MRASVLSVENLPHLSAGRFIIMQCKTFQINHVKSVQWVLLVIVYAVIFGILYLLEKYLQKGGKEMHINRRELFTVLIITAAVFAVSNLSYI